MPLYAEASAAIDNPNFDSSATFSFSLIQAVISWTRKARGPSGPTLAPESSEKKEESSAPGKVV
jgi:hypothetical protein